ncbi:Nudix family hydrolase [Parasulfuritortus cantonensis]|uniref:8-oxo-dGTP diphosphatase n=1 Tax=Parasulfuritortus cantonensis TaxID=2528202 RepID=A0A4R1BCF9_9PROT|nr:Nudix family hydrolase [Parasulfuritortus cantonensis]TCJ14729.1 Nudix family hydrolase [Parasulfuritortus cantonensis]
MNRVEVAAAVIERPDGRFLMASRPPGKVYAGWWEFPGGKVEPGETARHALDRELHEELGITVRTAYPWLSRAFDYEHARVMLRFFRVTAWDGEPHPHEGQGGLSWTRAAHPDVAPILPANGPILRGLELPLTYAISTAAELGAGEFLARLERALAAGLRLVQLREKTLPEAERTALATRCAELCRRHGAILTVNDDLELAARLGVGAHLSARRLAELGARPDLPWLGASCHDAGELARAAALGADFVVLGPVRPTASHPGAPAMGWPAFSRLIEDYPLPVYGLGGLGPADLDEARRAGAHGIAMRSAAWPN